MKFSSLIFANLFRKKIRLILTVGSFAVALFLFAFLAVVQNAFNRGADVAGADRLVVIDRVSIINLIPLKYRDQILQIPGVKSVTHNNWFGGVYQDEKNFFPQFVIDPESQRQVFPELIVPDDQWNVFIKDRQGAIAGARTAERFHWKVGDRIPIKTTLYGGNSWEFNLDGIYHGQRPEDDETQFWLQWDYFEERIPEQIKGQIGWYVLRVNNPDDSVRVAKAIDDKFANSSSETKTETESAFAAGWVKQFGNIQFLIMTIGTVVFFTLLLVTGNTMAISVRERTAELAVMKAIGYSGARVLIFILAESLVIALIGGLLGLGLALLAVPALAKQLEWHASHADSRSLDSDSWACRRSRRGHRERHSPGFGSDAHARCRSVPEGLTMAIPLTYNVRSVRARWTSAIVAVIGIAGTVGVFVAMLSLARGFRATLVASGSPGNALVMRAGSTSEMMGGVTLDSVKIIQDAPGIARDSAGPLVTEEVVGVIPFPLISSGTNANVQVRGVSPNVLRIRSFVKIAQGRMFNPGLNELIVGKNANMNVCGADGRKHGQVWGNSLAGGRRFRRGRLRVRFRSLV